MPKIITDEEIYQAVMQVVSERGYAGATTKQIAEVANVSEVTLFRKYDNKLQLIKQAVNSLVAQSDLLSQIQYTGDLNADLLRVVQAYNESAVRHGQFIFMMVAEMPRYPELATILDSPLGVFAGIAQLFSQYQAAGLLKPENPMHALAALLGPLIYVSILAKAMGDHVVPPLHLESHVAHFLEGRYRSKEENRLS